MAGAVACALIVVLLAAVATAQTSDEDLFSELLDAGLLFDEAPPVQPESPSTPASKSPTGRFGGFKPSKSFPKSTTTTTTYSTTATTLPTTSTTTTPSMATTTPGRSEAPSPPPSHVSISGDHSYDYLRFAKDASGVLLPTVDGAMSLLSIRKVLDRTRFILADRITPLREEKKDDIRTDSGSNATTDFFGTKKKMQAESPPRESVSEATTAASVPSDVADLMKKIDPDTLYKFLASQIGTKESTTSTSTTSTTTTTQTTTTPMTTTTSTTTTTSIPTTTPASVVPRALLASAGSRPGICHFRCYLSGEIGLLMPWNEGLKDRSSAVWDYTAETLRAQLTQLLIDTHLGDGSVEVKVDGFRPYTDSLVLVDVFLSLFHLTSSISDWDMRQLVNGGLVDSHLGPFPVDAELSFFEMVAPAAPDRQAGQDGDDVSHPIMMAPQGPDNALGVKLALIVGGALIFALPFVISCVLCYRKRARLHRARNRRQMDSRLMLVTSPSQLAKLNKCATMGAAGSIHSGSSSPSNYLYGLAGRPLSDMTTTSTLTRHNDNADPLYEIVKGEEQRGLATAVSVDVSKLRYDQYLRVRDSMAMGRPLPDFTEETIEEASEEDAFEKPNRQTVHSRRRLVEEWCHTVE